MKYGLFVACALLSVNLGGCFLSGGFKEGLIVDRKLQEDPARNIARNSKNVVDYAVNIYKEPPKTVHPDHVLTETPMSERLNYKLWAADFFKVYCDERSGTLTQWQFDRTGTAYNNTRGVGKKIIACESGKGLDSLLLLEAYRRDSTVYPYEVNVTFADGSYLKDFLDKNALYGFASKNGVVTFPMTRIYDPTAKFKFHSNDYTVLFNYENTSNKPVEVNLLNSYVMINGARYDFGFNKNKHGQDIIDWSFYSWGKESHGVFVGPEGSKLGKLRFNPGQKIFGEFKFQIPGRTEITEKDMESATFVIDGINCGDFKKVDYFAQNKKAL